ncbi:deoxyribose-phosphate aldolase [Spiroplasma turonicum]|uniref:Deoxyribose-phosphate aldolase n=1 Tax=Spiroplasma turonicum TaxID=216946 RepID=A0A0K1P6Y3_9MOLU|nr:deoxyribose-phosphate aldolase [Spiroplasma turonicum]AKU79642.1 deoxyribose-phosphate aldolase [Spiroplasma turonicum]ALX70663.1 deoxyribose-phosphate aldolase [Spiroplasma turonicum]
MNKLSSYIDHTLLKPEATSDDIKKLCKEAIDNNFATVCVNPFRVKEAKKYLEGSNVGITTVVGFPLGANLTEVKVLETTLAINEGASEIDMVVNIGAIKDKNWEYVLNDMKQVKLVSKTNIVKVILENCLLDKEEIEKVCKLAIEAGLDFVKTSTGFSKSGATFEDVKFMKKVVGDNCKVKAAGGVRTTFDALEMIKNGADRLGTSGGVNIVNGDLNKSDY